MRQKLFSITQILRFPSVCVLCQSTQRSSFAVCSFCTNLLTPLGIACKYCAFPLPDNHFQVCGECIKARPFFDRVLTFYHFDKILRTVLHAYKYKQALYLRSFLVRLMLDALPEEGLQTECLIPVPLHPARIKQRGFNQAAELAKCLAKKLNLPCELNLCEKRIATLPQVGLDREMRRKNIRNAFEAPFIPYTKVTVVDDLLTTGSTANELAKILKKKGVEEVTIWCCARTS